MKIIFKLFLLSAVFCQIKGNDVGMEISERWSDDDLFFYGMMAGGFVSLIGFAAAFVLLCCRKFIPEAIYTAIIQVLFSFSCGALLG